MRTKLPAASILIALLASGCGANTYSTGEPGSNVDLQRRVIRDPALASDVKITAARINDAAGTSVGQVTVQNTSGWERRIRVRWSWLDRDGANIGGSEQPWQSYTLAGGEMREITCAGGTDGRDFRITIRNEQ
jgi:uncharacterized protein YcfL